MTQEERTALYFEMKRRHLTLKTLGSEIGCSPSLLSQFFNCKANMSLYNTENLKIYLQN